MALVKSAIYKWFTNEKNIIAPDAKRHDTSKKEKTCIGKGDQIEEEHTSPEINPLCILIGDMIRKGEIDRIPTWCKKTANDIYSYKP